VSSDWRTRLGSFAAGLGFSRLSDDFSDGTEGTETSERAAAQTSRLRKVLDDLKAGDPNKGNAPTDPPAGTVVAEPAAVGSRAMQPLVAEPAVKVPAPEPAILPVKAHIDENPEAKVAKFTASAPVLNGERKAEPAMSDDVFLLVAEQRKAAEALLLQVAELERRLQTEAHAAQAVADYKWAKEKAEAAVTLEQQANELAHAAVEHHRALVSERQETDSLVVSTRVDAEAAKAKVEELQEQLRDARRLVDQTLSALEPREARAKELAANEAAAQRKAAEAAAGVTACQSARAQAEKDVEAAQKRAESLTSEIAELSARIAQQAVEVKRSREVIASAR